MTDHLTASVAAVMREAAQRAILPRWQSLAAGEIIEKAAGDIVTIADRESEDIIAGGLARLLPEAAIVGEEACFADPTVMERLNDTLCWIIDPLDGTNNFAAGRRPFGTIIALAERGETIGGWIYDPLLDRLCHATRGGGAFVNGERIAARPTGQEPPIAAISLLYMNAKRRAEVEEHIAPGYQLVDIPRCAAEQYARLVLGENDVSVFNRTLPWDHAAGVLLLNEAGGKAARPDGSPYLPGDHGRPGLVGAASPALWDQLVERAARLT